MNNVYVEAFINQSFNQDGNESAILKVNYSNPPNLIFQHLHVKEKVKKHRGFSYEKRFLYRYLN